MMAVFGSEDIPEWNMMFQGTWDRAAAQLKDQTWLREGPAGRTRPLPPGFAIVHQHFMLAGKGAQEGSKSIRLGMDECWRRRKGCPAIFFSVIHERTDTPHMSCAEIIRVACFCGMSTSQGRRRVLRIAPKFFHDL